MTNHAKEICENETRIVTLEQKLGYQDEKFESLIQDNKEIKKDINDLVVAVTELSNTLKMREQDSRKLIELENEISELRAGIKTLKYILPMIFTVVTIVVSVAGVIVNILM